MSEPTIYNRAHELAESLSGEIKNSFEEMADRADKLDDLICDLISDVMADILTNAAIVNRLEKIRGELC